MCRGRRVRMGSAGRCAAVVAATLAVWGCGGSADRSGGSADGGADRAAARGAPPDNHAGAAPGDGRHRNGASDTLSAPCPRTGLWLECHVVDRLEQAGLVLTRGQEPATEPPLERQGVNFDVRNATLEVYVYPDPAARERDQRRLDPEEYLAADEPPGPVPRPTLVTSGNLLVVLDTRRERQRERITLALTAGAPQPIAP